MDHVIWVSRMISDLQLFCKNNDLPRSAEALRAALNAFETDMKHRKVSNTDELGLSGEGSSSNLAVSQESRQAPDKYYSN
ncbi:hypothetical protein ACG74X_19915 [Marivita sp. S0852]|uniref:hypothetical protein n=1 Tax=Marivita sp. S0852 TaxID=3373893 RepID=UPI00398200FE